MIREKNKEIPIKIGLKARLSLLKTKTTRKLLSVSNYKNRYGGHFQYSIITIVRNSESYLNDFFKSLIYQTIDFQDHIQVILVNEGLEASPEKIIKTWQKKYPGNIIYLNNKNGGPGSAKNLGLEHATGDWVAFINPDDFLAVDYFKKIDKFVSNEPYKKLCLLSTKIINYHKKEGNYKNSHPRKFLFKNNNYIIPVHEQTEFFQPDFVGALFKLENLKESRLSFNQAMAFGFEESHFISNYLFNYPSSTIGVISKTRYYKRVPAESTSSSVETTVLPDYSDEMQLISDCTNILNETKNKYGNIPKWLQYIVLYHLTKQIITIVKNSGQVSSTRAEEQSYFQELQHLLHLLDSEAIENFKDTRFSDIHKTGTLGLFKNEEALSKKIHIIGDDQKRKLLKLSFSYHGTPPSIDIYINQYQIAPAFSKEVGYKFFNNYYSTENIIWISYADCNYKDTLSVRINQQTADLTFDNYKSHQHLAIEKILSQLKPTVKQSSIPLQDKIIRRLAKTMITRHYFKGAWVLMDRDVQADDNAEHLYRYIKNHHQDQNAFFVIRKSSHDWTRLKKEGFRLVGFNSLKHKLLLLNAKHLISSYFDEYVTNFLEKAYYRDMKKYNFTFLRHGISVGDMSQALNKKPIDLLISSTPGEYNSIIKDGSPYRFCNKETILTGLPRHDALLNKQVSPKNLILVMPTWRKWLAGETTGKGNEREINLNFHQSNFAKNWKQLLQSSLLKQILKHHNYELVFFSHINLEPYLEWFEIPSYISIKNHQDYPTIQQLFQEASCLVTDYSSVAFEMAYLQKPVLYYQFDQEEMFAGSHICKKGYFEFEKDGFGPVCRDINSLLKALDELIQNQCRPDPKYLSSMTNAFAYRDGRCCERVVASILSLYSASK